MKKLTITRPEPIKAFEQWTIDYNEDPEICTPIDSDDWAKESADYLISILER